MTIAREPHSTRAAAPGSRLSGRRARRQFGHERRLRPPALACRQNPTVEGSRPTRVRDRVRHRDLGPPRRSGRRSTSPPPPRHSSSARGSTPIRQSRFGRRSECSRRASRCSRRGSGEQVHGMTANAFMSVSFRPPLVLISVDRRARMGALLQEGRALRGQRLVGKGRPASPIGSRGRGGCARPDLRGRPRHAARRRGARAPRRAGLCAGIGAATTRFSSGRSSSSATAEGAPLLFHGGRYERVVEGPRVFSLLPEELWQPILASARRGVCRTASRSCGRVSAPWELLLVWGDRCGWSVPGPLPGACPG